ncbi:branchpoint-bridging protein [Trichinella spiralis]|uniref:branchpoint-bridging protein n=1 Tax=Trichinella spiralis TaxID=6334 RepID=UPI0001EFEAE3|nr:branchpoint-bridging protein [Trichinella spiralis]
MTAFSCFIPLKWLNAATFVALIFLKLAYSLHDVRTFTVGQPCIPNSDGAICQTDSAHAENLPNLGSQTKTWATEQSQPQNRANQQTLEYVEEQIYIMNFSSNTFNFRKPRRKTTNAHHMKEQPSESAVKYYTCVPDKTSSTCGVWKLKKCPQNKRFKFSKQACVEGSTSLRQGWFYPSMLPQSYMGGPFQGGFAGLTFDSMSMYGYGMPNYGMEFMSYGYGSVGYPMQVNYPGFSVIPPPVPLPPANQGAGNAPPPPANQPQAPPAGINFTGLWCSKICTEEAIGRMPTAAVELWHTCRQAENVEKENGKRDKRKMILRNMNKQLNMMTLPTHKSREWQRGDKHLYANISPLRKP